MILIRGMDHIVLNVADVERSLAFYRDVLGLEPERVEQWRAGKIGFPSVRIDASTVIDLMVARGAEDGGRRENLNHFCLVTDAETVEPVVAHLAAHGLTPHTGPARRWGAQGDGVSVYLRDPDGNEVELRSYAPAALAALTAATAAR